MIMGIQILQTENIAALEWSNNVYPESDVLPGTFPPEPFSQCVI